MKSQADKWRTEDGLLLLKGWARNGLKDTLIAKNMGITAKTLYEWKNKYSDICEALKKGKEPADIEVEDALFKAAIGYYVTVKEPIKVKTKKQLKDKGTIEEEHVEFIEKETYIPPNPTEPQQSPTEDHGEVIMSDICFTATFPASLIEEGEPIYCKYWTSGYASPSVESDIQAQYTVTANGMVLAVYEPDIDIAEEDMITYEYLFYQNGKVLARGTQTV